MISYDMFFNIMHCQCIPLLDMNLRKVSYKAFVFFCIFEKSGINEATDLAISQLQCSTIALTSAHVPGQHMWALARVQVLQNRGSQMIVFRFTTLSVRDCCWRNSKKKRIIVETLERGAIYKARVSVHWRAQCQAKWPRRVRAFQHLSGIEPMSPDSLQLTLTTKSLVHIKYLKTTIYESSYFATCNWFFCIQDCCSGIVQVEYQGRTRNTRILERKPLINTSYCILHRLGLKYFHYAQFLLNAHQTAHWPRKSENWYFEI